MQVEADDGATLYRFTFELVTVFMYIKDQKQNKQKKKDNNNNKVQTICLVRVRSTNIIITMIIIS